MWSLYAESIGRTYQPLPPDSYYANSNANSQTQPCNVSPQSSHSYDSSHPLPLRTDGRTPPPGQPNSAGSDSVSTLRDMSIREILGQPGPKSPGLESRDTALPPGARLRGMSPRPIYARQHTTASRPFLLLIK